MSTASSFGTGPRDLSPGHGRKGHVEQGRDLAGDAVDGRQVGTVVAGLDLEHRVDERQDVGERRPRLVPGVEEHDPGCGRCRGRPRPRRGSSRRTPRRAPCGARASSPFGSTAPGSATATVAPAPKFHAPHTIERGSPSPTSTFVSWSRSAFGCFSASSTLPTRNSSRLPFSSGDAAAHDAVDLAAREDEPPRELLDGQVELDVLAQPRDGHLHQNCSSMRTSFSQNRRRSPRPWRSIAMRSMPSPNAKPDQTSGS